MLRRYSHILDMTVYIHKLQLYKLDIIVLDKRRISRIVINGDTIYKKGGTENVAQADAP